MGVLFRKRVRLGPFLAVNLSRSGLSWTAHLVLAGLLAWGGMWAWQHISDSLSAMGDR